MVGTNSRRGLLALATVLMGLAGIVGCGGGAAAESTPRAELESAGLAGVHSGEIETFLKIETHKPGELRTSGGEISDMRIVGSFIGAGTENPPQFDVGIESSGLLGGRQLKYSGGLSLLKDLAVVYLAPNTYQPDKATFEELKAKYRAAQKPGEAGNAMACFEAAEGIDALGLIEGLKNLGRQKDRYGSASTYFGGSLDIPAAFEALIGVMEDPFCRAQLEALGMPPVTELKALKGRIRGPVEAVVAVDDRGIFREVILDGKGRGMTPGWHQLDKKTSLEAEFRFRLWKPDEVEELPLPSGSTPFRSLLRQFGTDRGALRAADGNELVLGFLEALGQGLSGQNER